MFFNRAADTNFQTKRKNVSMIKKSISIKLRPPDVIFLAFASTKLTLMSECLVGIYFHESEKLEYISLLEK